MPRETHRIHVGEDTSMPSSSPWMELCLIKYSGVVERDQSDTSPRECNSPAVLNKLL